MVFYPSTCVPILFVWVRFCLTTWNMHKKVSISMTHYILAAITDIKSDEGCLFIIYFLLAQSGHYQINRTLSKNYVMHNPPLPFVYQRMCTRPRPTILSIYALIYLISPDTFFSFIWKVHYIILMQHIACCLCLVKVEIRNKVFVLSYNLSPFLLLEGDQIPMHGKW